MLLLLARPLRPQFREPFPIQVYIAMAMVSKVILGFHDILMLGVDPLLVELIPQLITQKRNRDFFEGFNTQQRGIVL